MDTAYIAVGPEQANSSKRRVLIVLARHWAAFREWRKRAGLRANLNDLSDRELMDMGTTRGEIDYIVSNPSIDPLGARSTLTTR